MKASLKPPSPTLARTAITRAEILFTVAVLSVLAAALIPLLMRRSDTANANLTVCQANLRSLGSALLLYANDNTNQFPCAPTLESPQTQLLAALSPKYATDPKLFYCPADQSPNHQFSDAHFQAAQIGYFYYSAKTPGENPKLSKLLRSDITFPRPLSTQSDPNSWLMSDLWYRAQPTAHAPYKKGINYLTADGHVNFTPDNPRQSFH